MLQIAVCDDRVSDRERICQHIHIQYDGIGFIPLEELLEEETA